MIRSKPYIQAGNPPTEEPVFIADLGSGGYSFERLLVNGYVVTNLPSGLVVVDYETKEVLVGDAKENKLAELADKPGRLI